MIHLILTIAAGLCAGYLLWGWKALEHVGKAISVTIWAMLFIMGVKIGADRQILDNISTLGWQSLLLSLASVAGSVFFAFLLYRIFSGRGGARDGSSDSGNPDV